MDKDLSMWPVHRLFDKVDDAPSWIRYTDEDVKDAVAEYAPKVPRKDKLTLHENKNNGGGKKKGAEGAVLAPVSSLGDVSSMQQPWTSNHHQHR